MAALSTSVILRLHEKERAIIRQPYPSDKNLIKESWSKAFVQQAQSFDLYKSIASTGGGIDDDSGYDNLPWTTIPLDFVIDKPDPSAEEVAVRMNGQGWRVFSKDADLPDDAPPPEGFNPKERLQNMRTFMLGFGKPRMRALFVEYFNNFEPEYTWGGGRKVTSVEDLEEAYGYEPYDNNMRRRIDYVQNRMWGTSNQALYALEKTVMEANKIKYSDVTVNGEKPKKSHQGGSIKALYVRFKGSYFVNRFRNKGRTTHREILYRRKKGVAQCVKKMLVATFETYGFNGYIGICDGHPSLFEEVFMKSIHDAKNMPITTPATPAVALPKTPKKPRSTESREVEVDGREEYWQRRFRSLQAQFDAIRGELIDVANGGASDTEVSDSVTEGSSLPSVVAFHQTQNKPSQQLASKVATLSHQVSPDGSNPLPAMKVPEKSPRYFIQPRPNAVAMVPAGLVRIDLPQPVPQKEAPVQALVTKRRAESDANKNANKKLKKQPQPQMTRKMAHKITAKTPKNDAPRSPSKAAPPSPRKKTPPPSPVKVCFHNQIDRFQEWNHSYYAPAFLATKDGWNIPRKCSGPCGLKFFAGKRDYDPDKEKKVTAAEPVHCCPNGIDPDHACTFGLCTSCYSMHIMAIDAQKENQKPRNRPRRILLSPGEKDDGQGNIVASK